MLLLVTFREDRFEQRLITLLSRGDLILDELRSLADEAAQSQETLQTDIRPALEGIDELIEQLGVGEPVRAALDHLAHAWLDVLDRQIRCFDLLARLSAIHEEALVIVSGGEPR